MLSDKEHIRTYKTIAQVERFCRKDAIQNGKMQNAIALARLKSQQKQWR